MLDAFTNVEWRELFIPAHSIAEMIVRGTLMYLGLFLIFRFIVGRRPSVVGHRNCGYSGCCADRGRSAERVR